MRKEEEERQRKEREAAEWAETLRQQVETLNLRPTA